MWPREPFRTDGSPPACVLTGVHSVSSVSFQRLESDELLLRWCQKYCGDKRDPDPGGGVLAPLCLIYSLTRIFKYCTAFCGKALCSYSRTFKVGQTGQRWQQLQLRGRPSTHNYTDGMWHNRKDDRKGLKSAGEDRRENKHMKPLCDSSFHIQAGFATDQQDLGWHGSDVCCFPIKPPAAANHLVVLQKQKYLFVCLSVCLSSNVITQHNHLRRLCPELSEPSLPPAGPRQSSSVGTFSPSLSTLSLTHCLLQGG